LKCKEEGWYCVIESCYHTKLYPNGDQPSVNNSKARSPRQQRHLKKQTRKVVKKADSMVFFNLLTSPQLLGPLERLLPEFRERLYPPTVTLAMFLGQVLSADGSCQNAVNEAVINRLLSGLPAGSANTGSYCEARKRMPQEMARELARQTSALLNAHTPQEWLWRGRHVKMVDGTTILMPDTAGGHSEYPTDRALQSVQLRSWRLFLHTPRRSRRLRCAHSVPAVTGFTTLESEVDFIRPMTATTGPLNQPIDPGSRAWTLTKLI